MNPTDFNYSALSTLVLHFAMLIDSGRHRAVTVDDARAHIRAGNVLEWMRELDARIEIAMFGIEGTYAIASRDWLTGLERQLNASSPKDYGIEKNGLCLLLVFTVEQLRSEVSRIVEAAEKKVRDTEGPPPQPQRH